MKFRLEGKVNESDFIAKKNCYIVSVQHKRFDGLAGSTVSKVYVGEGSKFPTKEGDAVSHMVGTDALLMAKE